jgi:hypothetical protein
MASPVVVGVAETSISSAGTSHVVNLPAGAVGNLLLAIMDKGSTSATVNALTGWTELLDEASANGLYIAWRISDGSEGTTTTFTLSAATRGAWIVYEISGHDSGIPPAIGTTGTGTSATPDPPASATPPSSKDYLFIAFAGMAGEEADDDTWGNTSPTNYTPSPPRQVACGVAGANLGGLILSAERALTTGVAENPGTFGVDVSAAWRSQTIMVHPVTLKAGTDSGSGSDASTESAALPCTDSGSGADTKTLVASSIGQVSWVSMSIPAAPASTPVAGTDSGSGSDASSERAAYSLTETGTGADSIKAKTSAAIQTGAGTEVSSEHAAYTRTDAGAGTDASRITKLSTDAGAVVDASAERAVYLRTETGTGSDLSSARAAYTRTETGTGADASTVARAYVVTQSGTGTDVSTEKAVYVRTETGSGTDVSTLQAGNAKHGTDTAAGSDASAESAVYLRTDSGATVDSSSVSQGAAAKSGSDTGSGGDSSHLVASYVRSEAPIGFDLVALASRLVRTDAGVGTEAGTRAVGIARSDAGTAGDAAFLHALTVATDSASVLETASILALLSIVTDSGSGLEHASVWKGGLPPVRVQGSIILNRGGEHSTMQGSRSKSSITPSRPDVEVV